MQKITPFLWFDTEAETAATLYTSLFKNSSITGVSRYSDVGPGTPGAVMTVDFELDGQQYIALNGGPVFSFTEAVSFQIRCADQEEVDHFWYGLSEDGEQGRCGWLKDRFGLSWQVVPNALFELLSDPDPGRAQRATAAMLSMRKLDIAALRAAAENG